MKVENIAIGRYQAGIRLAPKVFAVGTGEPYYVNVTTGKHGNVLDPSDLDHTIDSVYYEKNEDADYPQPHLQIFGLKNTEIEVKPLENLIMSSDRIFKIVPPAIVVLNIKNVAESIIKEITYEVN